LEKLEPINCAKPAEPDGYALCLYRM